VQAGDIITAVDGASVHGFTTVSVIRGSRTKPLPLLAKPLPSTS